MQNEYAECIGFYLLWWWDFLAPSSSYSDCPFWIILGNVSWSSGVIKYWSCQGRRLKSFSQKEQSVDSGIGMKKRIMRRALCLHPGYRTTFWKRSHWSNTLVNQMTDAILGKSMKAGSWQSRLGQVDECELFLVNRSHTSCQAWSCIYSQWVDLEYQAKFPLLTCWLVNLALCFDLYLIDRSHTIFEQGTGIYVNSSL